MKLLYLILLLIFTVGPANAQGSDWRSSQAGGEMLTPAGNDNSSVLDVRVFPNPVNDKRFTVELKDQVIQEIRIVNIAGSVVYLKRFQVPVSRHQVMLENITNGVYMLRITASNNITRTTKLMVRNQ